MLEYISAGTIKIILQHVWRPFLGDNDNVWPISAAGLHRVETEIALEVR